MKPFAFHPELFEIRNEVLELLSEREIHWLSDFASVDLLHDVYGIEVFGIPDAEVARTIEGLLVKKLAWPHSRLSLKDYGDRDRGWKVVVHRDREADDEDWNRVS